MFKFLLSSKFKQVKQLFYINQIDEFLHAFFACCTAVSGPQQQQSLDLARLVTLEGGKMQERTQNVLEAGAMLSLV